MDAQIQTSQSVDMVLFIFMFVLFVFQTGRLYSTKFMRVLLRAKVRSFSSWGIELLVGQLYDQSRSVALTALSILDEACEDHVSTAFILRMIRRQILHCWTAWRNFT